MSVRSVVLLTVAALVAGASLCVADWEAGLAAFSRGDYEEAAREIKKYVETSPTDPRYAIAYYILGSSYLQLDQTEAAAARHFRLAGDEQAAAQIGELAASYREALDRRKGLLAKISELRKMETELGELNDSEGVAAVGGRADALQTGLDAMEANLETVRQALKNL